MFAAFFHYADTEKYVYLALDWFSCNSIGRGKRPGCHRPGGNILGKHVQGRKCPTPLMHAMEIWRSESTKFDCLWVY